MHPTGARPPSRDRLKYAPTRTLPGRGGLVPQDGERSAPRGYGMGGDACSQFEQRRAVHRFSPRWARPHSGPRPIRSWRRCGDPVRLLRSIHGGVWLESRATGAKIAMSGRRGSGGVIADGVPKAALRPPRLSDNLSARTPNRLEAPHGVGSHVACLVSD